MSKLRKHPLAVALPLTALLVVLAFFLPAQLSQWDDRALLDTPNIVREEERELFADSIRLTVPEKLLLLRSGDLSWLDLEDAGAGQVRVALVEGEAQISVSMEAELENAAADVQAEAEKNAQKWSARLSAAQSELRVLQRLGALPTLWSDTDVVELTSQREVIYIDQESQVSFTLYYMELSCAPYTVSLAVDAETGRILILTLRWTRGSAPSWGINGAMNFGIAWRDYWGLDGVDASWRSQYIQSILENTEGQLRNSGDFASAAEVSFTYDGQTLPVRLVCWASGSSRICSIQWNT